MRRIAQNVSWNRLVHELRSQTAQLQLLNTRLQSLTINASQTNNHLLTIAGQSQRNWEQLDYLNKCLGGFIGSVADSVEDEVVKAVENAQLSKQQYSFAAHSASTNRRRRSHEQQQQQQSKQWDMKFMLNYKRVDSKHGAKILYEIDGVGFACDPIDGDRVDHAIIVEAKHKVRRGHINEMLEKIRKFEETEQLPVRQAFIGGPKFTPQLQREAIRLGLGVVVLSGKRFTVKSMSNTDNSGGEDDQNNAHHLIDKSK